MHRSLQRDTATLATDAILKLAQLKVRSFRITCGVKATGDLFEQTALATLA